jgi:hypothetical protein
MAYSHSFSPEFYGDVCDVLDQPWNPRPTTLADAMANMPKRLWREMARDVFGLRGAQVDYLDLETVLSKAIETDTVTNLCTPVEVWIDADGFYRVEVY